MHWPLQSRKKIKFRLDKLYIHNMLRIFCIPCNIAYVHITVHHLKRGFCTVLHEISFKEWQHLGADCTALVDICTARNITRAEKEMQHVDPKKVSRVS